ncbi:UNVERIFIED_CONTAM: hypothetical protein PYX00_003028 [Menopon gallinae]|uniref:6-phosphofructo-2-kinase domain-containing protein n=1 Tax=Menopon gallinae TaxID=328185 RepID=A0AAW2HYA5_9NEOP
MGKDSIICNFDQSFIDGGHSTGSRPKEFGPLVVAFVGLPARGKTVLAHKLSRWLRWNDIPTEVFNVCDYCRKHITLYNHNMFRADDPEAQEMRHRSTVEAMEDVVRWLKGNGQVAILDGTNPNRSHRQLLYEYFVNQLAFKMLFIECVCDDDSILERNIKEILQFNFDYKQMKREIAMKDLRCKIEHFKEQYEMLSRKAESHLSFIKVINGGEDISVHRVKGQLENKILYYISNLRVRPRTLYFSRHGESEFNLLGRIGGDASLSPRGIQYAQCLARYFNQASIPGLRVWTSQKRRTKQTAQEILAPCESIEALNELDAGVCEGMTYEEMQEQHPQEFAWRDQDKLHYRYPWGESYVDLMKRIEPVLMQLESEENILIISHQAILRCVLGYFLDKKADQLPYLEIPLHTILKLTMDGYNVKMELIKLNVDCVDTQRKQPKNCSVTRTSHEALKTVPSHYDNLKFWSQTGIVGMGHNQV